LFFAAVCFFDCGIEHPLARGPDIRPRSVSPDKRNDRLIRNIQCIGSGNLFTCRRSDIFIWHKVVTVAAAVPAAIASRAAQCPLQSRGWTACEVPCWASLPYELLQRN